MRTSELTANSLLRLENKLFGGREAKGEAGQEKVAQSQSILEVMLRGLDFIRKVLRHYLRILKEGEELICVLEKELI